MVKCSSLLKTQLEKKKKIKILAMDKYHHKCE